MYDVLIGTESFYSEGSAHLTTTAITILCPYSREDRYKDVVGFKTTQLNAITNSDQFMTTRINRLNKNLVLVEHNEQRLAAKIFYKTAEEKIQNKIVHVNTSNDINFDIWLKPEECFWNPIDVLLEGAQDNLYDRVNLLYKEVMRANCNIQKILNIFKEDDKHI